MPLVLLLAPLLLLLGGCDDWRDPLPGRVTVRTNVGGKPVGCQLLLFNAAGRQLQEHGVNDGVVHIEKLAAGTYTLKFRGHDARMYPAVVSFKLYEAGQLDLVVDLNAPPGPAGSVAVSSAPN